MGGMRVLEWCVGQPDRVARAAVLAVGASATAEEIALCSVQCRAVRLDPDFQGGDYYGTGRAPVAGMALARGIGQITYRTGTEFDIRFGRAPRGRRTPCPAVGSPWSPTSGTRARSSPDRFDPNSYVVLSEAMNSHDVGRGRGGVTAGAGAGDRQGGGGGHRHRPALPARASRRTWPGCCPDVVHARSSRRSSATTASCSRWSRPGPWCPLPSAPEGSRSRTDGGQEPPGVEWAGTCVPCRMGAGTGHGLWRPGPGRRTRRSTPRHRGARGTQFRGGGGGRGQPVPARDRPRAHPPPGRCPGALPRGHRGEPPPLLAGPPLGDPPPLPPGLP